MTISNTELRERARTFLGTSLDEWARHVLRLLDENERCSTCEKCGWYTCEHDGSIGHADEIARLKAENAALVKALQEVIDIYAPHDHQWDMLLPTRAENND